jgi:hypothetical protein
MLTLRTLFPFKRRQPIKPPEERQLPLSDLNRVQLIALLMSRP